MDDQGKPKPAESINDAVDKADKGDVLILEDEDGRITTLTANDDGTFNGHKMSPNVPKPVQSYENINISYDGTGPITITEDGVQATEQEPGTDGAAAVASDDKSDTVDNKPEFWVDDKQYDSLAEARDAADTSQKNLIILQTGPDEFSLRAEYDPTTEKEFTVTITSDGDTTTYDNESIEQDANGVIIFVPPPQ